METNRVYLCTIGSSTGSAYSPIPFGYEALILETFSFLASPGVRPVWPAFHAYLQNHFEWSESILKITHRAQTELNLRAISNSTAGESYIALHLRRGMYLYPCRVQPP